MEKELSNHNKELDKEDEVAKDKVDGGVTGKSNYKKKVLVGPKCN